LEAERLAGPRGHHGDEVTPLEYGGRRLLLTGAEGGQAEAVVQGALEDVGAG
jgi:hypothetical protein